MSGNSSVALLRIPLAAGNLQKRGTRSAHAPSEPPHRTLATFQSKRPNTTFAPKEELGLTLGKHRWLADGSQCVLCARPVNGHSVRRAHRLIQQKAEPCVRENGRSPSPAAKPNTGTSKTSVLSLTAPENTLQKINRPMQGKYLIALRMMERKRKHECAGGQLEMNLADTI